MKRSFVKRVAIPLAIAMIIALTGCASMTPAGRPSGEEMLTTAAALTKVSAAVEANLRYGSATPPVSDAAFLAQSVAHDPSLLAPFDHVQLTLRRVAGHAALLEDAGCTAVLDAHRWRETPLPPCTFVLVLTDTCPSASSGP